MKKKKPSQQFADSTGTGDHLFGKVTKHKLIICIKLGYFQELCVRGLKKTKNSILNYKITFGCIILMSTQLCGKKFLWKKSHSNALTISAISVIKS